MPEHKENFQLCFTRHQLEELYRLLASDETPEGAAKHRIMLDKIARILQQRDNYHLTST